TVYGCHPVSVDTLEQPRLRALDLDGDVARSASLGASPNSAAIYSIASFGYIHTFAGGLPQSPHQMGVGYQPQASSP
ncbi:MAG: hypothetical protein QGG64_04920, partial [Candidatus Latescibacteria bacterium]|nr:hypothetical protein [Candidatus Latescibacterota bacterium]